MQIPIHMNSPVRTEKEQEQFFEQCYERYLKAREATSAIRYYYNIAGTIVCLEFAGNTLVNALTSALEHLQITGVTEPDCTIHVWESETTGIEMIQPPCEPTHFTYRGDIWGFNSKRIRSAFHWSEYSVNVMNMDTNKAVYWIQSAENLPYWATSSPFRTIFHWWMEKNGCQLLHAAAIGTEEGAVLITGKGGVGKSTTAISCLYHGLYYLADDYLIVRKDPVPVVYSLYSTGKLNLGDVSKFDGFEKLTADHAKKNQEKDVLYFFPEYREFIKTEMPLRAILKPEIKLEEKTRFRPASFWKMHRAISFTTMSQLPGSDSHTHDYLVDLCKKLPLFIFEPGIKMEEVSESIRYFLQDPGSFTIAESSEIPESEKPLISVIIPVYNGEKYISEAIENILRQEYPVLEIIVVDDGSTDKTAEVVNNLSVDVRYFSQQNAGPSAARNKGIKEASGKYIAFLDVDDLWPENNLNVLAEKLEKEKGSDVVRGYSQLFKDDSKGGKDYLGNPEESYRYYIGAGLYRRDVFNKVGLFDWRLIYGEDTDWYNRAKELRITIEWLDEVTLYVRRHGENMTEGKNILELNRLNTFKKILDRDRQRDHQNRLLKRETR